MSTILTGITYPKNIASMFFHAVRKELEAEMVDTLTEKYKEIIIEAAKTLSERCFKDAEITVYQSYMEGKMILQIKFTEINK